MFTDVRFALRMLRRSPGFTIAAVVVLTLGIGATTAMFGATNAVLLRPLPFPDADRLVVVRETRAQPGLERTVVSRAEYLSWTRDSRVLRHGAIVEYPGLAVAIGDGVPERLPAMRTSADLFPLLGLTLAAGRPFARDAEQPGHGDVAVISDRLARDRFGGAANAVGRVVRVEGRPSTVVGVLPPAFSFLGPVDLIVPGTLTPELAAADQDHAYDVYARLAPGVTREQADAEVTRVARATEATPRHLTGATVVPLKELFVGDARTPMLVLFGAVACVLLIACANLANLLLARGTARQREIAIRAALGARRGRVVRQLVTETLLLAAIGGAAGALLATWMTDVLARAAAAALPRAGEIRVDISTLLFSASMTLATGLLVGLVPALQAARADVNAMLKREGRGAPAGRRRTLGVFVVAEIALALVLLVGAVLMLATFAHLRRVDPGFDASRVLVVPAFLPPSKYPSREAVREFFRGADRAIGSSPGVLAVGATNALPLSGDNSSGSITIEGQPPPVPSARPNADRRSVTPGYFAALSMRVLSGRTFTSADDERAPLVVVVSRGFAARYWPGEDAVGKRVKLSRFESTQPFRTVIGVVNDVQHAGLAEPPRPVVYYPHAQGPDGAMQLVVKSATAPGAIAGVVRDAMRRLDPDLPVVELKPLTDFVSRSLFDTEMALSLLGAFALLAMLLAAAGVYGVMAYAVAQRTTEFGIRVALGAAPGDLVRLVGRDGLMLTGAGIAIGLAAARVAATALSGMVYGVRPSDPIVFLSTAALLAIVAVSACVVPALRALKVDPIVALRDK